MNGPVGLADQADLEPAEPEISRCFHVTLRVTIEHMKNTTTRRRTKRYSFWEVDFWIALQIFTMLNVVSNLGPCSSRVAMAESDDQAHVAAHLGVSYALNTFTYGFATRALHFNRRDALIFSAVSTLMIGAMWEVVEAGPGPNPGFGDNFKRSMLRNALGTGLSAGTVLMFDF